jgi:hypothetical protein
MVVVGLSCLRPCRKLFHKGGGNAEGTRLRNRCSSGEEMVLECAVLEEEQKGRRPPS